jgi:hypothetical protein
MNTDYVVRTVKRLPLLRHQFTVVDMAGHLHRVTVADSAAHAGMTDTLIRKAIARHPPKRPYHA